MRHFENFRIFVPLYPSNLLFLPCISLFCDIVRRI